MADSDEHWEPAKTRTVVGAAVIAVAIGVVVLVVLVIWLVRNGLL
jgi:uncharacterized membrane protein